MNKFNDSIESKINEYGCTKRGEDRADRPATLIGEFLSHGTYGELAATSSMVTSGANGSRVCSIAGHTGVASYLSNLNVKKRPTRERAL